MRANCRKDTVFSLNGNQPELKTLRIDDDYLELLLKPLKKNFVKEWNLSYNKISEKGAIMFADFLRDDRLMTHVNLRSNSIEPDGIESIAKALNINEALEFLDVSYNNAGNYGGMALAAMLQVSLTLQKSKI